ALLDRARELHDRLPQEPPTFTHGDLKTEHIWAAADGLTVMDFDSARPADPALDVGYFLADWQFQQADWDQAKIEGMYQSFFAGYAASARKETLVHRSEEHTSELQSHLNLVCRLLLELKKI